MNTRVRLTLGNDVYHLGQYQDPEELGTRILTAVRNGGEFIDLSSGLDRSVLVLISTGLPVKIERLVLSGDDDRSWDIGQRYDSDYFQL